MIDDEAKQMDKNNFKQWIIEQAKEIGIDKIGFTHAGDFEHLRQGLIEQKEKGYTTGFEHDNLDERLNPTKLMNDAKSIISVALAYPSQIKKEDVDKLDNVPRGQFSRSSWGIDYHHILNKKMNQLTHIIKQKAEDEFDFMPMVDTGALIDIAVAQRAGLGFIGRNGLLITKEFGSFVYLGEIITNIEFEPDAPVADGCDDCMKCIKACPGGALLGNGKMNGKKCLSYMTQAKGVMPLQYRKRIGNVIYGCDICQLACPYNQGKDFHLHTEMEPIADDVMPDLEALIQMSNKEFKGKYGYLAGSWRGKNPIQRNAIYALGNLRKTSSLPLLEDLAMNDPRKEIRYAARWSVKQLK
jgi:epoxyqueuosine reductase